MIMYDAFDIITFLVQVIEDILIHFTLSRIIHNSFDHTPSKDG